MTSKDRKIALMGWGVGAVLAIGAYVGTLQFFPASPSMPLIAASPMGVDMITTGSIGPSNGRDISLAPAPSMQMQARLDAMMIEMAQLRESLAATHAASLSTNRRLDALETGRPIVTASINTAGAPDGEQPLPDQIDVGAGVQQTLDSEGPRVVFPLPVEAEGGTVAVRVRPMDDALALVDDMNPDDMDLMNATDPMDMPEGDAPGMLISQTPFAIDLGGAASLEEVDRLWRERTDAFDTILQDLSPRILLQQTSDGALDLRLVAGPIQDAADAALLCAQLVAAGLERCLPAVYDGQQLALR